MIAPSPVKAKRMVYSIPWRPVSVGGGIQHARSAAYIAPIESRGFSPAALSASPPDLSSVALRVAARPSSSVETMVKRRSCPIRGSNCGKHGAESKTLQGSALGKFLGGPGETGVCGGLGTVYGAGGLKTGGGGG